MGLRLGPDMAVVRLSGKVSRHCPPGLIQAHIIEFRTLRRHQEPHSESGMPVEALEWIEGFEITLRTTGPMIPVNSEVNHITVCLCD